MVPMSFRINQVNQDPGISLGSYGCGDNMDHYMVTNDKKVYYSLVQDEARAGLEWLHELYAQGLIDPEIFSQDGATYSAKVASGRVGLFYDWAIGLAGDYTDQYEALPPLAGPCLLYTSIMGSFLLVSDGKVDEVLSPEGKVVSAAVDDRYKEALKYLKSLYDLGACLLYTSRCV